MGGSPLQVASRRFLPLAQHKHTPGYGSEDTKPHLAVHACVQSMLSATPSSGVVRPRRMLAPLLCFVVRQSTASSSPTLTKFSRSTPTFLRCLLPN